MKNKTLTLADAQPDDYRCVVANTCGITYSDYANITISGKMDIKLPHFCGCLLSFHSMSYVLYQGHSCHVGW